MSCFRPCIVIPIYNHKDAIGATLARLMPYGLQIFVVDDGSDEATRQALTVLAAQYSAQMYLLRLPLNVGKGGAVMAGLRAAYDAGMTHALQIDADGQHDAADVPAFLAAAETDPEAMVTGHPVYDASVPKARLWGRYVTHVWVWIETLSLEIRDSMCGFRVYPLAATCELLESTNLPTRMNFDIEILVRLHWRGLRFVQIPTRVVYVDGGISHFDALWDNVFISRTHAKLFLTMLWRAPRLLLRRVIPERARAATDSTLWWRMDERGSVLGIRLLILISRSFGASLARWCLYPIVAYFLVSGRAQREASHRYFSLLGAFASDRNCPRPGWRSAYRHMLTFAQASFDKFLSWVKPSAAPLVEMPDRTVLDALVRSEQGALVVGSHLGNLEMARALVARSGRKQVTAVIHTEHAQRFNQMMSQANQDFASSLLEVRDFGPETALMMQERVARGELLVIVGDRQPVRETGGTITVDFLGRPAAFPQGPWILAHLLECPVYLYFCLKRGRGGYALHFESFAERIELPRRTRQELLRYWVRRYAERLEHYCVEAPYQWFNFYDFWRAAPETPQHDTSHAGQ